MLFLPVAVAVLVSAVLGVAAMAAVWPVFVMWTTLIYCLGPRIGKKAERMIAVTAVLASLVVSRVAAWRPDFEGQTPNGATVWFVGPLVVAAALIFLCGGPKRIRARRARYEQRQSELRTERARLARVNRVAGRADRRRARRQRIQARTGLDVGLVVDAARDASVIVKGTSGKLMIRAAHRATRATAARPGRRLHREARTPRSAHTGAGRVDAAAGAWLDLDTDIDIDIDRIRSHAHTTEMLRLSDELDASATDRRPSPTTR